MWMLDFRLAGWRVAVVLRAGRVPTARALLESTGTHQHKHEHKHSDLLYLHSHEWEWTDDLLTCRWGEARTRRRRNGRSLRPGRETPPKLACEDDHAT